MFPSDFQGLVQLRATQATSHDTEMLAIKNVRSLRIDELQHSSRCGVRFRLADRPALEEFASTNALRDSMSRFRAVTPEPRGEPGWSGTARMARI